MKIYVVTVNIYYREKNKLLDFDYEVSLDYEASLCHAFTKESDAEKWMLEQWHREYTDKENLLKEALGSLYKDGDEFIGIKDSSICTMNLD